MAAISSIKEIPNASLTGQAEKTARPVSEQDRQVHHRENTEKNQPKNSENDPNAPVTPNYEETLEVVEKLQKRINEVASVPHRVSIHTDETTKQYVIKIQDPDGEVVKQFPSEKVLNLHQKLDDLSGMVIDEMI